MSKRKKVLFAIAMLLLIVILLLAKTILFKPAAKAFVKVELKEIEKPLWKESVVVTNVNYKAYVDKYDIIRDTKPLGGLSEYYYSKYIDYKAPNGGPIRLLAQDKVSDSQLLYAYSVLDFYLSNLDSVVANQMANNEATLVIPNGEDRDGETPEEAMFGQNLNQQEIAPPASVWFMESDYKHRDGSFEEIFHMVHDYGIGTTLNRQADPKLATEIHRALMNALPEKKEDWGDKGIWANRFGIKSWLKEIEAEGSLEQEYIITVIDSYYGFWEAYSKDKGMWGGYIAKTRSDVINYDPVGYEVIDTFLPEYIDVFMNLDETYEGDYSLIYDRKNPYTFKSSYQKDIIMHGSNNINIIGNNQDNIFMGNQGENIIDGNKGDDIVQLRGSSEEYTIYLTDEELTISDLVKERDGILILKNIEVLRFTDKDVEIKKLASN